MTNDYIDPVEVAKTVLKRQQVLDVFEFCLEAAHSSKKEK